MVVDGSGFLDGIKVKFQKRNTIKRLLVAYYDEVYVKLLFDTYFDAKFEDIIYDDKAFEINAITWEVAIYHVIPCGMLMILLIDKDCTTLFSEIPNI